MKRLLILLLLTIGISSLMANNVKVLGDIKVDPTKIKENRYAFIEFQLEWDNSWRDEFNYDAVYLFFKFRMEGDENWYHAYIADNGHTISSGYEIVMSRLASGVNRNEGVFIQRNLKGSGRSMAKLSVMWDLESNPQKIIHRSDFDNSRVETSVMGIEMVYIPRGAFSIGDGESEKTFQSTFLSIPEKYDLVNDGYRIFGQEKNSTLTASMAANHVNDVTSSASNAWQGTGTKDQYVLVDFGQKADDTPVMGVGQHSVQYFAIESVPNHVPDSFRLDGSNDYTIYGGWNTIYKGTKEDWNTSLTRVYPAMKAIKVTNPAKYRYYRVYISSMGTCPNVPIIKTLALTDVDLSRYNNYSVLVDDTIVSMNNEMGLSVLNESGWTGQTPPRYPNGYRGFYSMKYELSQEQWVSFLNKLTQEDQKKHTIGEAMLALEPNEYVYGVDHGKVNYRNNIMLRQKGKQPTERYTFANNYEAADAADLESDGQAIACNYLSPYNMLAYADWSGLRPLSEMEYEKMSRRPYPVIPERGEFAWNSTHLQLPLGLKNPGMKSEKMQSGNVNTNNVAGIEGPLRCGIFATDSQEQDSTGVSFWGVADLSGNLWEIYVNAEIDGRSFEAMNANHGDGSLSNGAANVTGWPAADRYGRGPAYGLRGGSFRSAKATTSTSDRSAAKFYLTRVVTQRDSTVGVRLGRSVIETAHLSPELTLQNGLIVGQQSMCDTICSGSSYLIKGDKPVVKNGIFTYIWYESQNQGKTWEVLWNENGQNLQLDKLINVNMYGGVLKEYWYKRRTVTPSADGITNIAKIRVIDNKYEVSRFRDTLTCLEDCYGVKVTTVTTAQFEWTYFASGHKIMPNKEEVRMSYIRPKRSDFVYGANKNLYGEKVIELKITIEGHCVHNEAITYFLPDMNDMESKKIKLFPDGYKAWGDGTYARNAKEYRNPTYPYQYKGDIGDGIYRVDPDGMEGPIQPFNVYCHMDGAEKDAGWMEVTVNFTPDTHVTGHENDTIFNNITYNLTKEQIIGLKRVATEGRQYFKKACVHSAMTGEWIPYGGGVVSNSLWPNAAACNQNDAAKRESSGNVVNLKYIPIWKYKGDDTGQPEEQSWYTFGNLFLK